MNGESCGGTFSCEIRDVTWIGDSCSRKLSGEIWSGKWSGEIWGIKQSGKT